MDVINAISNRRSIRKFKPDPLPDDMIRQILKSAIKAPSGKNRQPWEFVVIQGSRKEEMLQVMNRGIVRMEDEEEAKWPQYTLEIMKQAPVTIFVFNPYGTYPWLEKTADQQFQELVDIQSVGAAIQNMVLTATGLGVGSLWICDVFVAYEEFCKWMGKEYQMVAAVSFGYPDEDPNERGRKGFDEVVEW